MKGRNAKDRKYLRILRKVENCRGLAAEHLGETRSIVRLCKEGVVEVPLNDYDLYSVFSVIEMQLNLINKSLVAMDEVLLQVKVR